MADPVVVAPEVAPLVEGSPEYNQAMAEKFDKAAGAPAAPEKPAHVPDKFWNAESGSVNFEAWSKSTAELEKSLTQGKQTPAVPPVVDPAAPAVDPVVDPAAAEVAAVVENAGLDVAALNDEYQAAGDLSPESYAKLEKTGISKEMVEVYIAGQAALADARDAKGIEAAGGRDSFDRMTAWAKSNLSQAELISFNTGVSGTESDMIQAVQGLAAKYTAVNGSEPNLVGGNIADGAVAGFRSTREMTTAMKDPRYESDPAYRQDVINKLSATTAF